jgi:hypothetical protein
MRSKLWRGLALGTVLALSLSGVTAAVEPFDDGAIDSGKEIHGVGNHQHGGTGGHLPATQHNVDLIGKVNLRQTEAGRVSDVAALGNYAYLGAFDDGDCQNGGVSVVDISNVASPRQVGFIKAGTNDYVGEGPQAIHISTSAFTGDILLYNNEICGAEKVGTVGGLSIVNITNPRRPRFLANGVGDFTNADGSRDAIAHEIHSDFAWQAGSRVYVVMTDDEEALDVDIMDITDPRSPFMVGEFDLNQYNVDQPELKLTSSFLHDMVVKKIGEDYIMLLSYWDGGYIQLNVNDPAHPVFLGDTDYAALDPEQLALGNPVLPEGNGHQAEFVRNSSMFIATDEDFGPYKVKSTITSGPNTGYEFQAVQGNNVPQIDEDTTLAGQSVFVGLACGALPPAPAGIEIAIVERGVCFFTDKVQNVAAAGYQGGIVFNRTGVDGCEDLIFMDVTGTIPFVFVSRTDGFRILNAYDPATYTCSEDGSGTPAPAVGTAGADLDLSAFFDGWGYVHLYDRATFQELDTYSIPEGQDAAYASGFGDLSVHEVATDPNRNLAYLSYYAGGFRVLRYSRTTGLTEVGRYIAQGGNNFWGVQVHRVAATGQKVVLASDRDYGLFIFRYTGP